MRVEKWNPNAMDATFEAVALDRLWHAAAVLRMTAKRRLASNIGRGRTTGISRPVYRSGKYAGKEWTAREFGALEKSVRRTRLYNKWGKPLARKRNVRVYAGNYLAYYADIFEHNAPFMRPALAEALPMIKTMIGAK